MPLYHFNIHQPDGVAIDYEGTECAGLAEALEEAKASARDVALDRIRQGRSTDEPCVEVQDSTGKTVAALSVAEVLEHPYSPKFKDEC